MFIRPLSSLRERVIESYRRFELESKLRWRSIAASNYKRGSDGALSTLRIGNEAPLALYHRFELKSRLRWRSIAASNWNRGSVGAMLLLNSNRVVGND